jgi:hypothetical protein
MADVFDVGVIDGIPPREASRRLARLKTDRDSRNGSTRGGHVAGQYLSGRLS